MPSMLGADGCGAAEDTVEATAADGGATLMGGVFGAEGADGAAEAIGAGGAEESTGDGPGTMDWRAGGAFDASIARS